MKLVSVADGTRARDWTWNCSCTFCGAAAVVHESRLIYHAPISCGCQRAETFSSNRVSEAKSKFVGKTFGWLTVTEVTSPRGSDQSNRSLRFTATCRCGSGNLKVGALNDLIGGKVLACCTVAPWSRDSEMVMLDTLRQISAGADHLFRHRVVREVLPRYGVYDPVTRQVTSAGLAALAAGSMPTAIGKASDEVIDGFLRKYLGKSFGWLTITGIEAGSDQVKPNVKTVRYTATCKCGSAKGASGTLQRVIYGPAMSCCRTEAFSRNAELMRLDLLRQLDLGGEHLRRHVVVPELVELGVFDASAWRLTPAGRAAIEADTLPGYR